MGSSSPCFFHSDAFLKLVFKVFGQKKDDIQEALNSTHDVTLERVVSHQSRAVP